MPPPTWIRRIAVVMLCVGGAAYADWVLQLVLPIQASLFTSYVSELSANGQPFAAVFRLSDAVGGALTVLGAVAAWVFSRRWWAIWAGLIVLGISNIAEAMSPMRCVITFAAACAPPAKQSLTATIFNPHAWVSVLQTVSCFFVIIAGTIALRRAGAPVGRWRVLAVVGASALLISVIEGGFTVELLLASGDSVLGLVQRTEVGLTGLWLALVPAYLVVLSGVPRPAGPTRPQDSARPDRPRTQAGATRNASARSAAVATRGMSEDAR